MTAAQSEYLDQHGINPWNLRWTTEKETSVSSGHVEVALLPNGHLLRGNGQIVTPRKH